ncbi:zinc-ribbon domain-containing protein [Raoultibacter massiliensis]|uniref:zinc-ribbon domain-containing protein n=1 Tax=Raoultibacter massiliensis TaxID=1852371 RepID=UPI0011AED333|nr:zinc-ribbon domain-containing protein [Raoultibacter massiliensis]
MCQTCIGCGKCTGEVAPPLAPGTCPLCGYENDARALACPQCGTFLPAPPGRATSLKAESTDKR